MIYDRSYLIIALLYAIAGMLLGIIMAATQNHIQHVTHAHILLVGSVFSFVYAVIHRLWLNDAEGSLPGLQFLFHQLGALVLVTCLYLLYASVLPLESLEPVLALASISILLGTVLMLVLFVKSGARSTQAESAPARAG